MTLTAIALVVVAFGVLAIALGLVRFYRLRLLAGCGHCLLGGTLIGVGALGTGIGINLHTYQRLTHEQPVLDIEFVAIGPQHYTALVQRPNETAVQRYALRGDQWQLDARILKWTGPAILAGLDALYRLERLSGRYAAVEQELSAPRTVYALADSAGLDIWSLARQHRLPWVDTVYGSATYLPMADEARYQVLVTQSGLIARPANEVARRAIERW